MFTARPTPSRRGSAYVLILGLSALIVTLALGAIAMARIQARRGRTTADITHARLYAHAAVEMARFIIKNDPQWRQNHPNGTWAADVPVGNGTGALEVIDPNDGDLADDELHPVVLTGAGTMGHATQKMSVTLLAQAHGFGCLQTALHAKNNLIFNACTVQCDQTVSAGNNINASGADIYADAEAANSINGGTYHGTTTGGVDPRTMPDPSTVFNTYTNRGAWIARGDIPFVGGARLISKVVLSPAQNPYWPYGTTPEGIYYINCNGQDVCIRNCRIVGTLVLLDAGSGSRIEGSVNWAPAVDNYPALLVDGDMTLAYSAAALDEEAVWQNFNPPGTPYQGQSDTDHQDLYPSRIKGLVYVKDDAFSQAGTQTLHGVCIVGATFTAEAGSVLNLRYDATFANDPPPAFRERVIMNVAEGSWERTVD